MGDYSEPAQSVDNEISVDGEEIHGQFEVKDLKLDDTEPNGNGGSEDNSVGDSNGHQGSDSRKLFVGGTAWSTTIESFTNYFMGHGRVIDSVIIHDKHSGKSRGFGFVTFADPAVADTVLGKEHILDGKMVEVKRSIPKAETEDVRKIFVGGLPSFFTNDDLVEYFSKYGGITDHHVVLDRTTARSKGFGFVTFENKDAVTKVLLHDKRHELGGKEVDVRRAIPRKCSHGGTAVGHDGYDNGGQYSGSHRAYGNYNGSGADGRFCGSYMGFHSGCGAYPYGFGYGEPVMVLPNGTLQQLGPVWL